MHWVICVKAVMANWTKTQNYSAAEQLKAGIRFSCKLRENVHFNRCVSRYFDLRTSTKKGSNDLYFCHGLYSCKVGPVFKDVSIFLETHPQEVSQTTIINHSQFNNSRIKSSSSVQLFWLCETAGTSVFTLASSLISQPPSSFKNTSSRPSKSVTSNTSLSEFCF